MGTNERASITMYTHAKTLQLLRQIHLYLGVFTAPAILFFALSGVLQTFGLHETTKDSSYKPARWILICFTSLLACGWMFVE